MWDLLVSRDKLAPTLALAIKLDPITPNGTLQDFPLTYTDPINGTPGMAPDIGRGEQLQVSIDGIVQEPGADYTAAGNSIHFLNAPTASQRVWIVWFREKVRHRHDPECARSPVGAAGGQRRRRRHR